METKTAGNHNKWERTLIAMTMARKECSCGGKTILDNHVSDSGQHEYYVRCLNNACTRGTDILFDDPIEAVKYWNEVGWHVDPYDI